METDPLTARLNDLMYGPLRFYRLEGHAPVPCYEWELWASGQDDPGRQVADDRGADWRLSTVFLGLAMRRTDDPPDLFETILFPDVGHARVLARYATWEEAAHGHRVFLGKVTRLLAE